MAKEKECYVLLHGYCIVFCALQYSKNLHKRNPRPFMTNKYIVCIWDTCVTVWEPFWYVVKIAGSSMWILQQGESLQIVNWDKTNIYQVCFSFLCICIIIKVHGHNIGLFLRIANLTRLFWVCCQGYWGRGAVINGSTNHLEWKIKHKLPWFSNTQAQVKILAQSIPITFNAIIWLLEKSWNRWWRHLKNHTNFQCNTNALSLTCTCQDRKLIL